MADPSTIPLAHHFEDQEQQHETTAIGMWAFLLSEVMFFGGLFTAYLVYRNRYPEAFLEASGKLDVTLGTLNTAVLIGSSLTMALAVRAAHMGSRGGVVRWLLATIIAAGIFLGVKAVEYSHKFHDGLVPGANYAFKGTASADTELFFALYFGATGMHALHMVIGVGLMAVVAWRWRPNNVVQHPDGVEVLGLYWHFVDLVWIFLFPLLYLLGRHV